MGRKHHLGYWAVEVDCAGFLEGNPGSHDLQIKQAGGNPVHPWAEQAASREARGLCEHLVDNKLTAQGSLEGTLRRMRVL